MTRAEYVLTFIFGMVIATATMVASVVTVVEVAHQVALPPWLVGALPFALEPLAALAGWRWLRHGDRAAMWWTLLAFSAAVVINMAAASTWAGAALHAIFPTAVVGALHMLMHATAERADVRAQERRARAQQEAHEQAEEARARARQLEAAGMRTHADFELAEARARAVERAQLTRTITTTDTRTTTRTDVLELVRGDDARAHVAAWLDQGRELTEPALVEHLAGELSISPSSARRRLADARKAVTT